MCEQELYSNVSVSSTLFIKIFAIIFNYRKLFTKKYRFGGGNRDRTCDLLNANQMLSQLSYAPAKWCVYVLSEEERQ